MKVFLLKKPFGLYSPEAKRIILSAGELLGFNAVYPLIKALRENPHCRTIAVVAESIAERLFEEHFSREPLKPKFLLLKNKKLSQNSEPRAAWIDSLKSKGEGIFDVAIATVDAYTHPKISLLHQAKRSFGADKLFILHYGWTAFGIRKGIFQKGKEPEEIMTQIDGIFCNDKLAKLIVLHHLPNFSSEKIFITGTPIINGLEPNKAKQYYETGRKRLKLSDDDMVVLYLGDIDEDYKHNGAIDRQVDKKTFLKTVSAMTELARQRPEKKFVLIVRSHPRDPNKNKPLSLIANKKPLENLRIILSQDKISINEAAYAADVIASIISTENHLAPLRGRFGIFLGYQMPKLSLGLGQSILKEVYGEKMLGLIKKEKNTFVISSPEEFITCLKECYQRGRPDLIPLNSDSRSATENILDIAMAD